MVHFSRHELASLAIGFIAGGACLACTSSTDGTPDLPLGGASPGVTAGATSAGQGGAGAGSSSGGAGASVAGTGTVAGAAGASVLGGSGGVAGAAGASGGSAGAAGSLGGGGTPEDPRAAAQVLDGFAVLKPCLSSFKPSGNANNAGDCCCEQKPEDENQHITKKFGGDPNRVYKVKVRIAGVAERYWYTGGELDATSKLFYTGGLPTIHSDKAPNLNLDPGEGPCKIRPPETDALYKLPFTVPDEIRPTDGCYNGFNIFAMTVSSPKGKQSYYLNHTTDFDGGDRQPHSVYKNDYTVTISIPGQAQLDFYTIDGDHHQVTNNGTMSLPNLKTPQPYNGNFLEFTLVDVTVE